MNTDQIIIYQSEDESSEIEVKVQSDTIWLTGIQLAELFSTDRSSIAKHIRNIYKTNELDENSTCAKFAQVQTEGKRQIQRNVVHYSLELAISVAYRINSRRGTQFRIWANRLLREYLVKGYAINEQRLTEQPAKFEDLKRAVTLLSNVLESNDYSSEEAAGLLSVVTDYSYALDILDRYDHRELTLEGTPDEQLFTATYSEAMNAIFDLKNKFGSNALFGNEKDESFKGSIGVIYQSFGGVAFYPTIEEKAANLLYFVIKNHSFSDGNKRIGAYLFVWFLEKNKHLYRKDGSKRIGNNALVALTLMIAESKPEEKEMMVMVVVNLINSKN